MIDETFEGIKTSPIKNISPIVVKAPAIRFRPVTPIM